MEVRGGLNIPSGVKLEKRGSLSFLSGIAGGRPSKSRFFIWLNYCCLSDHLGSWQTAGPEEPSLIGLWIWFGLGGISWSIYLK